MIEFFQMPSGDWVRPSNVVALRIREKRVAQRETGVIQCTMFVDLTYGRFFTVDFDNMEAAVKSRDELAAAVKGEDEKVVAV